MTYVEILIDGDAKLSDGTFYHVKAQEEMLKLGDAEDRKGQTFGCLVQTPFGPGYVVVGDYIDLIDL